MPFDPAARAEAVPGRPDVSRERNRPGTASAYAEAPLPDYLRDVYSWAYLRPASIALLDRGPVVSAILWGNYRRLANAALAELRPGQRVLQPACVYGNLSARIATLLGSCGRLDVHDVVPLQIENCRRKLRAFDNVSLIVQDAASEVAAVYDAVCCSFLLHELPEDHRRKVLESLLGAVRPGGKVVFIDYHRPHWAHPLRGVIKLTFDLLEPFAEGLWRQDIRHWAPHGADFSWSKETYFGGLYQKTVARRSGP